MTATPCRALARGAADAAVGLAVGGVAIALAALASFAVVACHSPASSVAEPTQESSTPGAVEAPASVPSDGEAQPKPPTGGDDQGLHMDESDPSGIVLDPGATYFVGLLVANSPRDDTLPDAYCLDDGHLWRGAPTRVGRFNIFPAPGTPADQLGLSLTGKTVLVTGVRKRSLADMVRDEGPCLVDESPAKQFRSDWMSDEGGYRTTREKLAQTPYLEVTAVTEVELLRVDDPRASRARKIGGPHKRLAMDDAIITVTLRNPFAHTLQGVELVAHYEGGPGKPMPHTERHPVVLEPGAELVLELPSTIEKVWRDAETAVWRFNDARLRGAHGNLEILASPFFQESE